MQHVLVGIVVAGAAFVLFRMFFKSAREGTCPGGCGGCPHSSTCGQAPPEEPAEKRE